MGESAHDQGRFWDFHDRLFAFESQFTLDDIKQVADELDLKQYYYDEGKKEGRFLLNVKDDIRTASRAGVTTVPVLFVNGLYFSPTFPYDQLKALVSKEVIRFADSPNPPKKSSSSKQGGE